MTSSANPRQRVWIRRPDIVWSLALLTLVASVATLGFLSGGFNFSTVAQVVFVLAALVIIGVWLVRGRARPSRTYLVGLVAFAGFVAPECLVGSRRTIGACTLTDASRRSYSARNSSSLGRGKRVTSRHTYRYRAVLLSHFRSR